MKKIMMFIGLGLLLNVSSHAGGACFLAKEQQKVLKEEGRECHLRYPPQSTFKIPLMLMGFDAGILKDKTHPEWPYQKQYQAFLNVHKSSHNPGTWIRDSCLWYSQVLTQKLGLQQFKMYVTKFNYGNQDVSGDKGKNNGLTHAWLSSSLAISPEEQTLFLQQLAQKKLPVSIQAQEQAKDILYLQELIGGWELYGKTGSANQHGWFVGWIEKNGRVITFASHLSDDKKEKVYAGLRAKSDALIQLWDLIEVLEAKE